MLWSALDNRGRSWQDDFLKEHCINASVIDRIHSSPTSGAFCRYSLLGAFVLLVLTSPSRLSVAQTAALAAAASAEKEGLYEEAIRDYRAILKQSPGSSQAKLGLGRNLAKLGYCVEAADVLGRPPRVTGAGSEEKVWLGVCYLGTGDSEKAVSEFTQVVQLKPRDKELRIDLARAYAGGGHLQQAIDSLKAWLAANGNDADVLYWMGKFADDASEETFQRMRKADPNNYLVLQLMGEEYAKKLDLPKALEAYKKTLALKPDLPALHCGLGDVYWRMRKLDEAKEELEKGLKFNPYQPVANYELGDIYVRQGDAAKAIPYLKRALQVDPSLLDAHRTLGNAYSLAEDYARAIKEFELFAQQEPDDRAIHALLAKTYRRMGQFKEANKENEILQRLDKASMEVDNNSVSKRLDLMQHPVSSPPEPTPNH